MSTKRKSTPRKKVAKKRPGRPSKFTEALAARICREVAGGSTLPRICEAAGMPGSVTVWRWLEANEEFRNNYARARTERADARADKIDGIVSDVLAGKVDAQAARVAIDAHKWLASKEQPKRYGDKIDVDVAGDIGMTITIGGDDTA